MYKKLIYSVCLVVLLSVISIVQADTFSLRPAQDTYVANDTQQGPNSIQSGVDGIHIRNQAGRRRVGYIKYDISALKKPGRVFSNVSLSNMGWDRGNINVYGLIETVDSIDVDTLNWNNAPGVKNNPTPALDSPVVLDFNDLTEQLMPTFRAPARNTRESTPPSQALADFLNSDTDGIIVLVLAPAAVGDAGIVLAIDEGVDSGTLLEGEFSGLPKSAYDPVPPNEEVDIPRDVVLSWTPGAFANKHNVYFGTSFADVNQANTIDTRSVLVSPNQDANTYNPVGLLALDTTYYWRIDEVNAPPDSTIYPGSVWSFRTEPVAYPLVENIIATASSIFNADTGPEKTINNTGLNNNDQHSILDSDMWLSNPAGTGPSWLKYKFDNFYKLHQMWVWNSNQTLETIFGVGVKSATVEYSLDGNSWTPLAGVPEFAQAPGAADYTHNTTVDFGDVVAKFVKITANSNWGGLLPQYGLSEVRFFYIPERARQPMPASGQTDVGLDAILGWRAGRSAVSHDVYFSSDMGAIVNGTALVGKTAVNSFAVGSLGLELSKTYYWKVNEVNEAAMPTVWEGEVWSFTTNEYLAVDDFELYDDSCNRIYYTWGDGSSYSGDPACGVAPYSGNKTGSTVGNLNAPFAERTIIHSGLQSMPLEYNNSAAPYYSQTQRQWALPQDWTRGGAKVLSLWFYGATGNSAESLYVAVQDSSGIVKIASYTNPQALQTASWQEWRIDLTTFTGVDLTKVKAIYIGVGNMASPTAGGTGKLYFDDIRLY